MAEILSDIQIQKLIGSVIINGDETLINPNSIELRLGKSILFHSTDEELELNESCFLKIHPGETITFTSYETIDFRQQTIDAIFPNERLMGLLTPTTTMMREGISQVTTKIDVGYYGILNWALRNGAAKDIIIQCKEPIFKLTLFKLKGEEIPQLAYGERSNDSYQNSDGINRSTRKLPANIPKNKIVQSSFGAIDVKKQLKEAGYPFDYISTELTELHGRLEIVSKDVMLIKDEFNTKTAELTKKIDKETEELKKKIDKSETNILEKSKVQFSEQFTKIAGVIIGAISIMYGLQSFLKQKAFSVNFISTFALIAGIAIIAIAVILTRKNKIEKV